MKTVFLATTPLHALISLGLMRGPFRDCDNTLALINKPGKGRLDLFAEALGTVRPPGISVMQIPRVRNAGLGPGRSLLNQISAMTRGLSPAVVASGNDRRPEFYAALRGCPSARRIYVDDGMYSYVPNYDIRQTHGQDLLALARRVWSGLATERPSLTGGSVAMQEAYILLPERAHAGLSSKIVHALEPQWFADPWVSRTCAAAAASVGLDIERCRSIGLLLILPHPRLLKTYPELREQIELLASTHALEGKLVALKGHPESDTPLEQQLNLPAGDTLQIPPSLPIEALAPLLSGTLVVGALTSALLFLALLGERIDVRNLSFSAKPGNQSLTHDQIQYIYSSVGIQALTGEP